MSEKVIYDNGSSQCVVKFDGEVVILEQRSVDSEPNTIFLYEDELEEALAFIKSRRNES